ncbi:MAG: hypothetical protein KatS3mg105_3272 [Gemmatales bacterium]|nr:MAG: hypothetical protein KatS3mg105_3272 [Gemmatales bacterium]
MATKRNTYRGQRSYQGIRVFKNGWPLSPTKSLRHRCHSPAGFCWGSCGPGADQLALALLLEETTEEEALALYQLFKFEVVASFPVEGWHSASGTIQAWLEEKRAIKARSR